MRLYTVLCVVAPIQFRTPQTPNFFGIFLPFVKPFSRKQEVSMDIPVIVFLVLCNALVIGQAHNLAL